MSETVNISEMAEKVSKDIFEFFGWKIWGPTNENTPCLKTTEHRKESSPTHPTDVVFTYEDPYEQEGIYLLTDLKSYAKDTIKASEVKSALHDLAKSIDCANISNAWREKYTNNTTSYQIHGLLFIYNHDGNFDKDFTPILRKCRSESLTIPRDRRLYVVGPKKIEYLLNVVNDVKREQADRKLPLWDAVPFLHPDRIRKHASHRTTTSAHVELLLGPWILIPYSLEAKGGQKRNGIHFYYDGPGATIEEFTFIFDFCFKNQLVQDEHRISIRMPNADNNAQKHFETAKEVFNANFYVGQAPSRINQFDAVSLTTIVQKFSTEQIGMERRK